MRLRFLSVLAVGAAAASVAAGAGTAANAQVSALAPTCADGRACTWLEQYYNGTKSTWDAGWAGGWVSTGWEESLKNRFGNRKVRFQRLGGDIGCVNPGGERPDPGTFDAISIGAQDSRCQ